jgi:hypothetical protein
MQLLPHIQHNLNSLIYQNIPFITPNKFTVLINTNIQDASPTCVDTSVPTSERRTFNFVKPIDSWKAVIYEILRCVAASV